MTDAERKAQDNALRNVSKKTEAAKIQQELCDRIFNQALIWHGPKGSILVPDLMCLNNHNATKEFYKVLNEYKIEREAIDFDFSDTVGKACAFTKEDTLNHNKAYGQKGKRLRELALLFATMADTFDIIDKWSEQ